MSCTYPNHPIVFALHEDNVPYEYFSFKITVPFCRTPFFKTHIKWMNTYFTEVFKSIDCFTCNSNIQVGLPYIGFTQQFDKEASCIPTSCLCGFPTVATAGVTGRPVLAFLDGTPHKQCLVIILYPARDPPTCYFSWLWSYLSLPMRKLIALPEMPNWWGLMMTTIMVDYSYDITMTMIAMRPCVDKGQAFCLLMLESMCHLWYCISQEVDVSVTLPYSTLFFQMMPVTDTHADALRAALAVDFPKNIWWTVTCNNTVLFLFCDVKNIKFNQYLLMVFKSLKISNSRFQKPAMFWMWRHHSTALWCHDRGAWHNVLFLMTDRATWTPELMLLTMSSKWGFIVVGDIANFNHQITPQLWAVSSAARAAQSWDKNIVSQQANIAISYMPS